ncbi:MAG TPA: TlpA disulfide reductase family protein [Candidatus Limnocylindrales bacterium]|jgi:thiol-disulfide isomerase/thioredoxin
MRIALVLGVIAGLLVAALAIGASLTMLEPVAITPTRPTLAPTEPPTPSPGPSVAASEAPSPSTGVGLGDRAPALLVGGLGESDIDLAALAGSPVWVNFTASWCPTCRDELGMMERFALANPEVAILVIDVKEPADVVQALVDSTAITMPVGLDLDGQAQLAWNAYALPVHYFVDRDGIVREYIYGGPGPEQMLAGLKTILPEAQMPDFDAPAASGDPGSSIDPASPPPDPTSPSTAPSASP